jgi:hypothetical protein
MQSSKLWPLHENVRGCDVRFLMRKLDKGTYCKVSILKTWHEAEHDFFPCSLKPKGQHFSMQGVSGTHGPGSENIGGKILI